MNAVDGDGYVKLWRKIMKSQVWISAPLLKVFVWCVMKATRKERWARVNTGRGVSEVLLKRGQFIYGRKTAAKELLMKPGSVRNRMQKLKDIGNVDIQPDTHYSVITVLEYDTYQAPEKANRQATGQATDNQRTGNGQATDTDKTVKNEEECKEGEGHPATAGNLGKVPDQLHALYRSTKTQRNEPVEKWALERIRKALNLWHYDPQELEQAITTMVPGSGVNDLIPGPREAPSSQYVKPKPLEPLTDDERAELVKLKAYDEAQYSEGAPVDVVKMNRLVALRERAGDK